MGSLCSQPGEVQTVTVRSTPGYNVAWAVLWPDSKEHWEWGAHGITKIGVDGTFTAGFVIPATAPSGRARTDTSVGGVTNKKSYGAIATVYWEIEKKC